MGRWIRRVVQVILMGLRFGGLFHRVPAHSRFQELGARNPDDTDYLLMPELFGSLQFYSSDVLVDVGCGRGRVINWWLKSGVITQKIYGLELDPDIANRTSFRLSKRKNVRIIGGDAIENLPAEGTFFYLANPFDETVMRRFKQKLLSQDPNKPIRILYYLPWHVGVFEGDPNWEVSTVFLPSFSHKKKRMAVLITRRLTVAGRAGDS